MKVNRLIALSVAFVMAFGLSLNTQAQKSGYALKFVVKNYSDSIAFLAYRYGEQQYLKDTTEVLPGGKIHFSGKESLPGGVYSVVSAKKAFMFEVLVDNDEQNFTMTTDTLDYSKMTFKGAPQNMAFMEYRTFVQKKGQESKAKRERMKHIEKGSDEYKALQSDLDKIDEEVKAIQGKIAKDHAGSLLAYILKAQQSPKIPTAPAGAPKDFAYRWFKTHYWDNFDFSDDRIARTPIYEAKLKYYFEKMIIQHPDTVVMEVDDILTKTMKTPELYKQTFVYLYKKYNASEIVCMDKVYVRLALKWYTEELAFWSTESQRKKIQDRAKELFPIQCGMRAPNMRLKDTLGGWHELYRDQSRFTVLYFWDPECGHCKTATPKLPAIYEKYKDQGVNVWGICTKYDSKEWRAFIKEHNLSFLNVSDNAVDTFYNNMRDVYDIFSTPVVYVLDNKKRIITKRISVEQLDEYLKTKLEEEKTGVVGG